MDVVASSFVGKVAPDQRGARATISAATAIAFLWPSLPYHISNLVLDGLEQSSHFFADVLALFVVV